MSQHASISRQVVLSKLELVDQMLTEHVPHRRSLCPGRAEPTPLRTLARSICEEFVGTQVDQPEVFAEVGWFLLEISEAIALHFPENIFWDLDFPALQSVRGALSSELGPQAYLTEARQRFTALISLYGIHGRIRFRYAHDFLYGFDWARWVDRDPTHLEEPPFGFGFLDYGRARGHQLLSLIDNNDEKYPPIDAGARRNPFSFSRGPEAEKSLHEALAADALIPVEAWDPASTPRPGRSFSEARDQYAERLGLGAS